MISVTAGASNSLCSSYWCHPTNTHNFVSLSSSNSNSTSLHPNPNYNYNPYLNFNVNTNSKLIFNSPSPTTIFCYVPNVPECKLSSYLNVTVQWCGELTDKLLLDLYHVHFTPCHYDVDQGRVLCTCTLSTRQVRGNKVQKGIVLNRPNASTDI